VGLSSAERLHPASTAETVELVRRADERLYAAKRGGRDCVVRADEMRLSAA